MPTRRRFADQEPRWRRLEALLAKSGRKSLSTLSAEEIREMATLYRHTANDLALARSIPGYQHLEPYLNNLLQRCHGRIYNAPPVSGQDVGRFFRETFPRCFRKHSRMILLAGLVFILGSVLAMLTVYFRPETERFFLPEPLIAQLEQGVLWTDHARANPSESSFLMTNNIRVAINAFAFGILFGIGTLVLLFHNGMFAFGGPLQVCMAHDMGGRLLNFIAAHGIIELTTIFIAGGAGMTIGFALLFPGDLPRWQAVRQKASDAMILMMGCIPLLVVAGLIEGLISLNQEVGSPIRVAVALLSALFLIGYLGFSGRENSAQKHL